MSWGVGMEPSLEGVIRRGTRAPEADKTTLRADGRGHGARYTDTGSERTSGQSKVTATPLATSACRP